MSKRNEAPGVLTALTRMLLYRLLNCHPPINDSPDFFSGVMGETKKLHGGSLLSVTRAFLGRGGRDISRAGAVRLFRAMGNERSG